MTGRVRAVEKYRLDEIPSTEVRRTCRASVGKRKNHKIKRHFETGLTLIMTKTDAIAEVKGDTVLPR